MFLKARCFSVHFVWIWHKLSEELVARWILRCNAIVYIWHNSPKTGLKTVWVNLFKISCGVRCQKKQDKWTIFGEVIWILWIFSPRRNSIASPWSPCSGTTSSSSMSTRKSSSPMSTPFPCSEITDSAVDLRRSWSYYAIFVFFLWYCPGLLILCATDTSNNSGGKERRTTDNRSELSQTRS